MNVLLSLCLAMIAGLIMTRLMKLLHLPNVTGYLIAGLIVGPFCLKFVEGANLEGFSIITTVALGFIAFSIGGEFKLQHIKQLGSQAMVITFAQAFAAVAFVDAALLIAGYDAPLSITLGAIATATAPAATLMVVRQYKANGPVTRTLLPVVALDDAIGLMVFSVSIALAKNLAAHEGLSINSVLIEPLVEIVLSLLVGAVVGVVLSVSMKIFHSRANRICLMTTAVIGGVALSQVWGLSSLLVCMMIGAIFANMVDGCDVMLENCERWTPPLFMLFFVISGAELDFAVLPSVGMVGVIYIIFRSLGKYLGSLFGATVVKADKNVKRYLGLTLLPQAGVAVGMAQMAMTELPDFGNKIRAVVLCATLVYELVGPVITKIALTKAGEIEKKSSN